MTAELLDPEPKRTLREKVEDLRDDLAIHLYYSTWPLIFGWNPTRLCNSLSSPNISYGGARWDEAYDWLDEGEGQKEIAFLDE